MSQIQQTIQTHDNKLSENLVVSGLHKIYNQGKQNEVHVLKGIELFIPKGQITAIMGPSGCGKTTLLNLIGGLDSISSGSVSINGKDISIMRDKEITQFRRFHIGYIFQLFNLFEDQTALENVILPLLLQKVEYNEAVDRAKMILQEVGLGDRYDEVPGKLSGGEQQKVAIARSLVTNPNLILADEPTGDLDTASSNDIMQLFRRMQRENQDMSIVVVTHSEVIARKCDRIIRIDNGKIASDQEVVH